MRLLLLRHATATPAEEAEDDFNRPLVAKGLEQLSRVGRFCREYGMVPELVLSSPVLRARQTAEAMVRLAKWPKPSIEPWLACGMRAEEGLAELVGRAGEAESVALVGHEPDLSSLGGFLLGSCGPSLRIRKACLLGFELEALRGGGGALEFLLPCRLMPR